MATKQTDAVAMTEEQLDAVAAGFRDPAGHILWNVTVGRRSSNPTPHPSPVVTRRPTDAGRVVGIWTTGGTSSIWGAGPVTS